MPKVVDHEQRRDEVAHAVIRLVSRSGTNRLTVRDAASESGWSTGMLSHYFANKRELLVSALRLVARRVGLQIKAVVSEPGVDPLEALATALTFDDDDTRVWLAFWGEALADPDLTEEQCVYLRNTIRLLEPIIVRGQRDGTIRADLEPAFLARMLLAVGDGLCVQSVFDPAVSGMTTKREHMRRFIELIAPARG